MKRKDTKLYQDLANKYCKTRNFVEDLEKRINEYYAKIGKAKKKFDFLSATPKMDEDIKEWYEGYTNTIQMTVGLMEHNLTSDKERMEQLGKTLVADYEEDLDELYKTVKG